MSTVKRILFSLSFSSMLFALPSDDFLIDVKTDNPGVSSDTEFEIPIMTTTGTGYNVDCNDDGTLETMGETGSYTCSYGSAGTYTIRIIDNNGDKKGFRRIRFGSGTDAEKLIDIKQWGTAIWSSMSSAFRDANNTTVSAVDIPDFSDVKNLKNMFNNCTLADPDTSAWDISNIENLSYMFRDATSANPNVGSWNTANVTNMRGMFRGATSADPDVSSWNTANVEDFFVMFFGATNAQPVTATSGNIWNTSSATNMGSMFRNATNANPDVSQWDTSSVTKMSGMFRNATNANPNVTNWDTSSVNNMSRIFQNATNANPDVTNWNTSQVSNIGSMFRNATLFDRNMSGWDVSSVTAAGNFLLGVQLTQANYDALLASWGSQAVQNGVTFHAGTSQYCSGEGGRNVLLANSWSITDGGRNCGGVCASAEGTLTADHWTTISFPCATGANGIEALIGTAIGGTYGDNDNWVVYEQSGDYTGTSDSMVLLAASDTVEPAKGYWIISDHNTTWHIDGALSGLSYTPTVTASSLGISSPNFDYVHLRDLPDTAADEQKLLLGNPFPHDINLSDIYFSGAGAAFSPMDGNANNDPYVNDVVYTYDHVGDDQSAYQAISTSTPGFDKVIHQQGFWLRLKPGAVDTNRLTFPQVK